MKLAVLVWAVASYAATGAVAAQSNGPPQPVSQVAAQSMVSPDKMREDLDYLVRVLGNVHPATFGGFSSNQQAVIDSAHARIKEPLAAKVFFFVVNSVICSLQDAHTHLAPIDNTDNRRLDVPVICLHDGYFVQDTRAPFEAGDRIVGMGHKSIDEIFRTLRTIIPAENEHYRRWGMADMLQREEFLDYVGAITNDSVTITLARAGKETSVVARLTPAAQYARPASSRPWVDFKIYPEDSLGVFVLDQCLMNEMYLKTLLNFFEAVRSNHISNVAIDVRRNGGGNSQVVDEFFRYLDIDSYRGFGGDIRYSKEAASVTGERRTSGYFRGSSRRERNRKVADPPLIFKGKLFVLTSPRTFSSGNWFAVIVKDNGLGTILGEPTGNAPSSYGDVPNFQLPNTGFRFWVSYKRWVRPNPANDPADALYPDVLVWTTIEDVVQGADPQLRKLKDIIRRK